MEPHRRTWFDDRGLVIAGPASPGAAPERSDRRLAFHGGAMHYWRVEPARSTAKASTREVPSDVIPDVEWRRREHANLRNALKLAEGRIYGPNGAAEVLGVKPTTLISRLKALGLRDASPRRRRSRAR